MMVETVKQTSSFTIASKVRDYMLLIKFSLSFMVVFSAVVSYLLAPKIVAYDWGMIMLLFVGGLLVTGSANAVNQVVEKDTDALMNRTAKRPVASGRMSVGRRLGICDHCRTCRCVYSLVFFQWLIRSYRCFQLVRVCFHVHAFKKGKFGIGISGSGSGGFALPNWLGGRPG